MAQGPDLAGLRQVKYGFSLQSRSLNEIRFTIFTKSLVQNNLNLDILPPIEEAALLHSWRAFLQVNLWTHVLDPIKWGWKATKHELLPSTSTAVQVPQELLNSTACKCSKGCRNVCGCRRQGMECSPISFNCRGASCTNVPEDIKNWLKLDAYVIISDVETVEELLDEDADNDFEQVQCLQLTSTKDAKVQ
ncbi:hypothetical protein AVEN_16824-1 [Araneus ventricosus]|uniref:Tesmin/TSO1-like CXC domain-containing protein n=1 Tax=Araneus ventricosus TaxID=182803 RepID=A0A4Y2BRM2_ARAVE|nr:hypothetical protein AVEN_16824-1 [Araneus ventricosus]